MAELPYLTAEELQLIFGYNTLKGFRSAVTKGNFPAPTYRIGENIVADKEVIKAFFQQQRDLGAQELAAAKKRVADVEKLEAEMKLRATEELLEAKKRLKLELMEEEFEASKRIARAKKERPYLFLPEIMEVFGFTNAISTRRSILTGNFPIPTYKMGGRVVASREIVEEYFREKARESLF